MLKLSKLQLLHQPRETGWTQNKCSEDCTRPGVCLRSLKRHRAQSKGLVKYWSQNYCMPYLWNTEVRFSMLRTSSDIRKNFVKTSCAWDPVVSPDWLVSSDFHCFRFSTSRTSYRHASVTCFPFIFLDSWLSFVLTFVCLAMSQCLFELAVLHVRRKGMFWWTQCLCCVMEPCALTAWISMLLDRTWQQVNIWPTKAVLSPFKNPLTIPFLHCFPCRASQHKAEGSGERHMDKPWIPAWTNRLTLFALERKWLECFPHCLYEPMKNLIHPITSHSKG